MVKLLTTEPHGLGSTGNDALGAQVTGDNLPPSSQKPRDMKKSRILERPWSRDCSGPLIRRVELTG